MITRAEYEEAKENCDIKIVQEYADQVTNQGITALNQFRKCEFTDEIGHELVNNIEFQALANMVYWKPKKQPEMINGVYPWRIQR